MPSSASRNQARLAVDQFVARFDPSYRLLAYHAALPLLLTPELLNYLRTTFLRNQVPWVAEADLLLSGLCQQVGYELYTMDTEVRAYLLDEMRATLGSERMQAVARLLIQYVRHLARTNPLITWHELQTQQWAAMVYLDDQRAVAVHEIACAFQRLQPQPDTQHPAVSQLIDHSEFARLSELTQSLAQQLEAYPELVRYAQQVSYLLRDDGDDRQQAITLEDLAHPAQVADVDLPPLSLLLSDRRLATEPPIIEPASYQYDVFISYSYSDHDWIMRWLVPHLDEIGLRTYIDVRDFPPGEPRLSEFERAIMTSRYTLAILTPNYLANQITIYELLRSQTYDITHASRRTLTLLLQPCQPLLHMATLPYADFRQVQDQDASLQRVVEAVQSRQSLTETWPTLEQLIHLDEPSDYQYDVFISYSHSDRAWVMSVLLPQLEVAGLRVGTDEDFEVGNPTLNLFENMLVTSRYVMAVLTPDYVAGQWSSFYLKLAQAYERITSSWHIVPLLLRPCTLPPGIATRTLADLIDPPRQDAELQRVIARLQQTPIPTPLSEPDLLAYVYHVFISYSSTDEALAERLYADLQAKGVRCWFAPHDLEIGAPISGSIDKAIRISDKVLIILSEASVKSRWVEFEVSTALHREEQEGRTVLYPLRLDDAVLTTAERWAVMLRDSRYIGDFRQWKEHDSYQAVFTRLLRDLKAEQR